jgi:NAD+ kinase
MAEAITRVGLAAKRGLTAASPVLVELSSWLEQRGVTPVFDEDTARLAGIRSARSISREALPRECDLVVVLGGDGTLIGMADRIAAAESDVPILAVNFGSLGFLTEITLAELYEALDDTLAGRAVIDTRAMLATKTIRDGSSFAEHIVLNDMVITRGSLSRIIEISVSVNGAPVTTVRADGLIIASPTGSTAYNLAAGGPIVHPAVDAMLLTPIAPHTLSNRPIVIPAASNVQVRPVMDERDEVFVTFDGQIGFPLRPNDLLHVTRAPRPLRIVKSAKRTYFDVLRQKLKWGGGP